MNKIIFTLIAFFGGISSVFTMPLYLNGRKICEATEVERDLFLTAAHCVSNSNLNTLSIGFGQSKVEIVEVNKNQDLALLTRNSFKIGNISDLFRPVDISKPVSVVLSSGSKTTFSLANSDNFGFYYSVDSKPGDSGSGVYQEGKLVGIHLGNSGLNKLNFDLGFFVNPLTLSNETSFKIAQNYDPQFVQGAIIVAGVWCEANPQSCERIITTAIVASVPIFVKAMEITWDYMKRLEDQKRSDASYQKAVEECKADHERIVEEINGPLREHLGSSSEQSGGNSAEDKTGGVEILKPENVVPRSGDISILENKTGMICSKQGNTGGVTCYTPFGSNFSISSSTVKFLHIFQAASIRALMDVLNGKAPSDEQISRMAQYLSTGSYSIETAADFAIYPPKEVGPKCGKGKPCSEDGTPF